jgi:hypothetical protein
MSGSPDPAPSPLPGLATDAVLAAGRTVVECQDCHHPLAGREARLWGRGRACRHKQGLDGAPSIGRFAVPQETLPAPE